MLKSGELWDGKMQKTLGRLYRGVGTVRNGPGTVPERSRNGLGTGSEAACRFHKVSVAWQAQHFRKVKYRFRGRRSTFARSRVDFVAGAALAQHFRKVRSSINFVAGTALSQGQV